jgi:integrase
MPSAPLVKTKTPGIFRRGSRYVVIFRDTRGRQRKRFATTLAEARVVKASLATDVARGEYRERSRLTFAEYAAEWCETYSGRTSKGVRPQTLADYKKRLEQDAIPFLGRLRLSEVEPRDVKALAAHIARRGVSANTIRLSLAPVRALFATAVEDGLVRSNPTLGVRVSPMGNTAREADEDKAKALTPDELAALLEAIPERERLFFRFLAQTGLRIGEAVGLRVGDVDLGRRRVQVRRRWYRDNFAPPKSKHGRRDVPLSPATARALWPLVAGRAENALLFTSETGRMIDQSNLSSRVLKPAARRAGVPWCSFHTFRHTAASTFFRAGWNAKQVQLVLGHHSPAFTLSTYVHLIPDDLPDASFLDEGGQQGGNTTHRNVPNSDSQARPQFTAIAGEMPDEPRQAEAAAVNS